jgi:hypothetical protein
MRLMIGSLLILAALTMNMWGQSLPCKQETFVATAVGGKELRHGIGDGLELVMVPYKSHQGWSLRVSPIDSEDDWTYPVNPPLDGEAQSLGSGWGIAAREQLKGRRRFRFTLNASDFARYSKLADDALHSSDPNAAAVWIAQLKTGRFGSIILTDFQLEMEDSSEAIKSARFKAKIIVPKSFGPKVDWESCPCE